MHLKTTEHPQILTLNPQPQTLDPSSSGTRSHVRCTLKPKPETLRKLYREALAAKSPPHPNLNRPSQTVGAETDQHVIAPSDQRVGFAPRSPSTRTRCQFHCTEQFHLPSSPSHIPPSPASTPPPVDQMLTARNTRPGRAHGKRAAPGGTRGARSCAVGRGYPMGVRVELLRAAGARA